MKLGSKDLTYLRLGVWGASLVWMVMFIAFTLVMAWKSGIVLGDFFGGTSGVVLSWVVPIWMVFTCFLIIIYMARFIGRKLS